MERAVFQLNRGAAAILLTDAQYAFTVSGDGSVTGRGRRSVTLERVVCASVRRVPKISHQANSIKWLPLSDRITQLSSRTDPG
ncbi:Protein of unknown function [Gryllus bimaculatus]|nr:Protein of unknown function [Gryllus bimaculatus]